MQLDFEISKEIPKQSLIGELVYQNIQNKIKTIIDLRLRISSSPAIIKAIESNDYDTIKLESRPHDICVLPNNHLLTINFDDMNLTIYDEKFNLVKRIDTINNEIIKPYAVIINDHDQCYVLDWKKHCVLMTDIDFNFIKSVGSQGSNIDQFQYPISGYYKNSKLYVADSDNQRIKIFKSDLTFVYDIQLDYMPYFIKMSDTTICITSAFSLLFYDSNDFKLIENYDDQNDRISEIHSLFYSFNFKTRKINCFDWNGDFIKEIKLNHLNHFISGSRDCVLLCFNENLLMTFRDESLLARFKLQI